MELKQTAYEAAKAGPPGVVVGVNKLFDISLSDAVLYMTLLYTAIQLAFFLYDRYALYMKGKQDADKPR